MMHNNKTNLTPPSSQQITNNDIQLTNRLFAQKKGYMGPIILMAFVFIFGIIWFVIRFSNNSSIDQQISAYMMGRGSNEGREYYLNKSLQTRVRCNKETIRGVVILALWYLIWFIVAVVLVLLNIKKHH